MPRVIAEDENTITYEGPDGRPIVVAKEVARRLALGGMEDVGKGDGPVDPFKLRLAREAASDLGAGGAARRPPPPPLSVDGVASIPGGAGSPSIPASGPSLRTQSPSASGGYADINVSDTGAPEILPLNSAELADPYARQARQPSAPPPSSSSLKDLPFGIGTGRQVSGAGMDLQMLANETAAEAAQRGADAEVAAQAAHNALIDKAEAKRQQAEQFEQQKLQSLIAQKSAAIDASVNAKFDPGRFWHDRSTGQKVMAGIGLALGAVGEAFAGKPNQALTIIMNAIENDVALQVKEIDKLKQDVALRGEQVEDWSKFATSNAGLYEALIARALAKLSRDLQLIAKTTASEQVAAKAMLFDGEVMERRGLHIEASAVADRAFERGKFESDRAAGIAAKNAETSRMGVELSQKEYDRKIAQADAAAALPSPTASLTSGDSRMSNPVIGHYRFKGELAQFVDDQDRVLAFDSAYQKLLELRHMSQELGRTYQGEYKFLKDSEVKAGDALVMDLATAQARALNGAKMSDRDIVNEITKLGGGLRGFLDLGSPDRTLEGVQRRNSGEYKAFLRSRLVDDKGNPDDVAAKRHVDKMTALSETQWAEETQRTAVESLEKDILSPGSAKAFTLTELAESAIRRKDGRTYHLSPLETATQHKIVELAQLAMTGDRDAVKALGVLATTDGPHQAETLRLINLPRFRKRMEQLGLEP